MAVKVGEPAPDAKVFIRPREQVNLNDMPGRPLVVFFFPLAYSGVCTKEICAIAEDYSAYRKLGASVVGMSVDSPYVNEKFAQTAGADFPILSDFNREASRAYGVLRNEVGGLKDVSERAAFIIGSDGRIKYAWVGASPGVFPPLDEIKAAVKAAS